MNYRLAISACAIGTVASVLAGFGDGGSSSLFFFGMSAVFGLGVFVISLSSIAKCCRDGVRRVIRAGRSRAIHPCVRLHRGGRSDDVVLTRHISMGRTCAEDAGYPGVNRLWGVKMGVFGQTDSAWFGWTPVDGGVQLYACTDLFCNKMAVLRPDSVNSYMIVVSGDLATFYINGWEAAEEIVIVRSGGLWMELGPKILHGVADRDVDILYQK